ncbi:MAG: NAD(P)-dependent oxidoreductase [Alicyclobacillaceae bacterium]|nr:NAD(P)-dependent oxidoreductase [Alicyclobacillaceae bacterium]
MSTILVTGSQGTIGKRLVPALRRAGHDVWQCDLRHTGEDRYVRADVGNYRQLERVFDQEYDYVFHLAAEFGRINGEEYYDNLWQTNVVGTRNILEFQRKKGFKLIFASSSEIYGQTREPLLYEDLPLQKPVIPHNDYAATKWVNEIQIMNYEQRYGVPVMRLRLFNAYGPGEYYHPYRSVVCLFLYRALHGLPYTVFEGYHRAFMYVDDLIRTLVRSVERFRPGEVYNIGGREYKSVRELSDKILALTGAPESLVTYLPEDVHNTVSKRPDITKAVRDLGHDPTVDLDEGLPLTLAWMREVYGV